ncbi:MAG: hypothetical protein RLP02_17095 [Coleofasciculus sp. C2-GNP5-27]
MVRVAYWECDRAQTPEAITDRYRTVTLEQVHATILYYLHNQETVSAYLADWLAWSHHKREQQRKNPPSFIDKLRQLQAKKQVVSQPETSTVEVTG